MYAHSRARRRAAAVCSGRTGSLYHEEGDAAQWASWSIDYVKYDNCGQYGLGDARFVAFADAANATGRPMVISTEPFSLIPTGRHREFAHLWRTTNDINAHLAAVLDRSLLDDRDYYGNKRLELAGELFSEERSREGEGMGGGEKGGGACVCCGALAPFFPPRQLRRRGQSPAQAPPLFPPPARTLTESPS